MRESFLIVKIQESRTYVKKKQREVCNFVNKPKFQCTVLCVLMMNGKLHTSDSALLADLRSF